MKKVVLGLSVVLGVAALVEAVPSFHDAVAGKPEPIIWDEASAKPVVTNYINHVSNAYQDVLQKNLELQKAIQAFLNAPSDATLANARTAWKAADQVYSRTETFRFYDGPIDFNDEMTDTKGPEGEINAWPLNEAHIDYVQDNPKAGLIQNLSVPISTKTIQQFDQSTDESDITTGYHAIEFLLWGQDLSAETAGNRPYTDYLPGDKIRERRRQYLKLVTQLLIDDTKGLVSEWQPGKNYAKTFADLPVRQSIEKALTGMVTLSEQEMASERLAVGLDSGDQENEQSCFSDSTKMNFVENQAGIMNVYKDEATPGGMSFAKWFEKVDPSSQKKLQAALQKTTDDIAALHDPFDQILASPKDSSERKQAEKVVADLQNQSAAIKEAAKKLGITVLVAQDND